MTHRRTKSGFTLVEILIVVIILGILAAIVIPQFTSASQDARKSNMASQLQSIRAQVELYKLQHRDLPPKLITTGWNLFIDCTDDVGAVSNTATPTIPDATFTHGPYMPSAPVNPLVNAPNGNVIKAIGTVDGSAGWTYDETTGVLHGIGQKKSGGYAETEDGYTDLATGNPLLSE